MTKKKMNVDEAMGIIKTIDSLYQIRTFAKKMSGEECDEADMVMDRFHEAVLVVDNYITTNTIDIVDGGKKGGKK